MMVFLLLAGLPVAIVLGVVSTAWVMLAGSSMQMIASRMYAGIDVFVLMAIPFFILAGEIMNRCGITDRLIKFVDFVIGRVRGGLAQANIYASLLFAGITGAAVADVAALGSIFIPAMEKQGYTRKFSATDHRCQFHYRANHTAQHHRGDLRGGHRDFDRDHLCGLHDTGCNGWFGHERICGGAGPKTKNFPKIRRAL